MRIIKNQDKKVELLTSVLHTNIFSGKSNKDDYLSEAYEIVELIDGQTDVKLMSELVADYYITNSVNDHFSDFESIAPVIVNEYLLKLSKLKHI